MMENDHLIDGLDAQIIRNGLTGEVASRLGELRVEESVSSTNDVIKEMRACAFEQFVACVANQQISGRGRNGRNWQSPANANIYLSLGCYFEVASLNKLSGLSLACGVSVARWLEGQGCSARIKWPNDIMVDGRKLAGLLIETHISSDKVFVVIGLGMNVKMPDEVSAKIDQPWIDLQQASESGELEFTRNELVSGLLNSIIESVLTYRSSGFTGFKRDWQKFDALSGQMVEVSLDGDNLEVRVIGLADDCSLRVEVAGVERNLYAGDVKLKMRRNAGY